MTDHHFDIQVAAEVGVMPAVIYHNIRFWCVHSRSNGEHFHEGKYWTFNSVKAFNEQFPYLTEKQIRTALNKLVEASYIQKGNFNKASNNHTNWYCDLRDIGLPIRASEDSNWPAQEGNRAAHMGKSYNDNKKPDRKNNISRFSEFWEVFADKRGREAAQRVWKRKHLDKIADEVIVGARAYASSRPKEREYWKMAQGWLNDGRWQDQTVSTGKVLTDEDKARLRAKIPQRQIKTKPSKFLEKFQKQKAVSNG